MDLQEEYAQAQPAQAAAPTGDLASEYESAEPTTAEGGDQEPPEFSMVREGIDMGTVDQMVKDGDFEGIGKYVAGLFNAVKEGDGQ
jgi:hypothetical protein